MNWRMMYGNGSYDRMTPRQKKRFRKKLRGADTREQASLKKLDPSVTKLEEWPG